MRCILALIPPKKASITFIYLSQMLFSSMSEEYLLSESSLPHITVCQFECNNPNEATAIWDKVKKLNEKCFSPFFTGISFIKKNELYQVELSVRRDSELMKIHHFAKEVIESSGFLCLTDCDDLYRPHLTLALIRRLAPLPSWPDSLFDQVGPFKLALGEGDINGQYLHSIKVDSEIISNSTQ